jgi:hypothetical protein
MSDKLVRLGSESWRSDNQNSPDEKYNRRFPGLHSNYTNKNLKIIMEPKNYNKMKEYLYLICRKCLYLAVLLNTAGMQ